MSGFTFNREELAWAAGFFDGEGCSSTSWFRYRTDGTKRPYPTIQIAQAGPDGVPEVLLRFQRAVRLGVIRPLPTGSNKFSKKPMYGWKVNGFEATQAVIAILWDWLSGVKREQYKEMITRVITFDRYEIENPRKRRGGQKTTRHHLFTDEELNKLNG